MQVWENETRKPFADFTPSSGGVLDRPHWSDRDGEPRPAPVDDMPTPAGDGWRWVTDSWSVDTYPPVTSRDGWQYAGSFAALALAWAPSPAPLRFVRRRRHVRLQQLGGDGDEAGPLTMFREFIARSRGSSAALFGVVPAYVAAGTIERASWGTTRLSVARLSAPIPPVQPMATNVQAESLKEPEPEVKSDLEMAEQEPQTEIAVYSEPGVGSETTAGVSTEHNHCADATSGPEPEADHQALGTPPGFPAPSPPSVASDTLVVVSVAEDAGGAGFVCNDELIVTKVQRGKAADNAGLQRALHQPRLLLPSQRALPQ